MADGILSVPDVALNGVAMESKRFESAQAGQFVNLGNPANVVAVQVEHRQVLQLKNTLRTV